MISRSTWYLKGKVISLTDYKGKMNMQIKGLLFRPKLYKTKCTTDCALPSDERIKRGKKILLKGCLVFTDKSVRFKAEELINVTRR